MLHGARKREQNGGEDEDGEGTGDSSDAGESEIASNENEGEEHDGGGEGQTQVIINKLSRWRADGKIPGRVTVSKERECSGEEGERGQQIPDDGSYSDIQHLALENNDDDLGLVNGSPEKEDQAKLRDRETAENQECLLCGEWGHGMKKLEHACWTSPGFLIFNALSPLHSPCMLSGLVDRDPKLSLLETRGRPERQLHARARPNRGLW